MSDAVTLQTPAGPASLHRSNRATLSISVLPDGALDLVAPHDARECDIVTKVGRRLRWIVRQRTTFSDMNRGREPLRYEAGATHRYLGRQYRLKVTRGEPSRVRLLGGYFHVTTSTGNASEVKSSLDAWLRSKAIEQFSARLAKWEPWCVARKLPKPQARLLRMPKRWGSAHPDGRIYFNPELVKAPSICVDYVVAHEVCHLKQPHHDRAFFRLLDQIFPNWSRVKARLENF